VVAVNNIIPFPRKALLFPQLEVLAKFRSIIIGMETDSISGKLCVVLENGEAWLVDDQGNKQQVLI